MPTAACARVDSAGITSSQVKTNSEAASPDVELVTKFNVAVTHTLFSYTMLTTVYQPIKI